MTPGAPRDGRRRFSAAVAAVLLSGGAATVLTGCDRAPDAPAFQSTDITGATFGKTLALTGHDGRPRTLDDFRGKAVVLFFGFTHCPDVCPTALARFATVMKALGADADRVQVLFVTVDPARDTQPVLAQYVPAFDPRFLGLTGSQAEVEAVAKEFRVVAQKQAPSAAGDYSVDHSTGIYVFDPQGRIRLFVAGNQEAGVLEHDLRELLRGA
jgi:protein SCO1/2